MCVHLLIRRTNVNLDLIDFKSCNLHGFLHFYPECDGGVSDKQTPERTEEFVLNYLPVINVRYF